MPSLLTSGFRFAVVGCLATGLHVGIFLFCVRTLNLGPTLATTPAFLGAMTLSYTLNHSWTFGARGRHCYFFLRYLLVALLGVTLNLTIMFVVTRWLGKSYYLGLALVVLLVPLFNFLGNRYWGFRRPA